MSKEFVRSIQDLIFIFSARPIAIPLMALLIAKLYSLEPATLIYTLGLLLLTALFSARWCVHLIASKKSAFLAIYKETKENKR